MAKTSPATTTFGSPNRSQSGTVWRRADAELLPENGNTYEVIDGELFMAKQPHWHHQETAGNIYHVLQEWSRQSGMGRASLAPGVWFSEIDDIAPDVVWVSKERFEVLLDGAGHLAGAPELIVEILSPGTQNERRDREVKLKLYEVNGVQEYWIADWRLKQVEVYRREGERLRRYATLLGESEPNSPLLPNFMCRVSEFFD